MGSFCSKNFKIEEDNEVSVHPYGNQQRNSAPMPSRESTDKYLKDQRNQSRKEQLFSYHERPGLENLKNSQEFYDGIPRAPDALFRKSRSLRSTQATVAKVSEVSTLLGRAGTMGLEKAVEVLDVLGSSMTDLNSRSGFVSKSSRGTKISVLAFEVANTIMMGSKLMHTLSERGMKHLKETVLPSQGVQTLISKDMDELLKIVSLDKRQELDIFSAEIVRFGNRCKDPQWHNLDRYFLQQRGETIPPKQLMVDAEVVMNQLMTLVESTLELYHELNSLDRFEQGYHFKHKQDGEQASLQGELKKERKVVKNLKKRSLWTRSLEEVIEKLVDIVVYLHLKIHDSFDADGQHDNDNERRTTPVHTYQRLGKAGLALHYANIVLQLDGIVARSSSMTLNSRDSLYQNLPPSIKLTLRSKLHLFQVKEELNVSDIKAEMEKTLQWLVPMASNTVKSHHGFGWVGEWANSGCEPNRSPAGQTERIDTFYHADKEKTEALITEQLLWLHYLIMRQREANAGRTRRSTLSLASLETSTCAISSLQRNQNLKIEDEKLYASSSGPSLTVDHNEMLLKARKGKRSSKFRKSEDFDLPGENCLNEVEHERLSKSSGQSPTRESKDLVAVAQLHPSSLCMSGPGIQNNQSNSADTVEVVGQDYSLNSP